MSAGKYNLTIEQGTTFTKTFTLKIGVVPNDPNPVPFDFTGYTGAAQLRESYDSAATLAAFNVSFPPSGSATGSIAASGSIIISMTPDVTAVLPGGYNGVWDLLLFQGSVVTRLLEGTVFISPSVTR